MKKPVVLQVAAWILTIGGGAGVLGLLLAPLDLPIYSLGATTMSGRVFLATAGIPFGLASLLFLAAGISLLREHAWSRALVVAAVLGYGSSAAWIGLKTGDAALTGNAGVGGVVLGIVAAIYLYRSSAVRTYYRQLSQRVGDGA